MAHKYWRIFITASNGNQSREEVGIAEVEMHAIVSGPDQCVGGVPSSSSHSTGYEASKAFDDNTGSTQWICNASEPNAPWWLRYRFPTQVDVVEVVIYPPSTLSRAPKDFEVQYSDDGAGWVTWFSVSGVDDWSAGVGKAFVRMPAPHN